MRRKITEYIRDRYGVGPEYPWVKYDDNAVFRHEGNRKWFALIMDVRRDRLDPGDTSCEVISVINLKIADMALHDTLVHEKGIIPAYHMNKQNWITVYLDGSVPEEHVEDLIDVSYINTLTIRKAKKGSDRSFI